MKLTLHIGHGKTGSSALQSFLALNAPLLREYGVYYPENDTFDSAKKGFISSGNLSGDKKYNEYIYQKISEKVTNHYLFSNEGLMAKILMDPASLLELANKLNLEIVLYCRNPLDHAFSSYGQFVKRGGGTSNISDWINSYNTPQRIIDIIKLCKDSEVVLKLINYSKIDSIEKSFCDVLLGDKSKSFLLNAQFTKQKTINRSLSRVEYEIQREFNKHMGSKSSRFISDPLVNKVPDLRSEKEYIKESVLENFIEINKEKVAYINTFLNKDEELELYIAKDVRPQTDNFEIGSTQIAILAESISQQIVKASGSRLVNSDADMLREIALKFENNKSILLEDAYYLMGLAHKARPEGPVIRKKYKEYESRLAGKCAME